MTDATLVRRVLDGDTAAFTMLVDRHAAACTRFAMRMLGNREDAEDAVQDSFLRAYRSLARYEEPRESMPDRRSSTASAPAFVPR